MKTVFLLFVLLMTFEVGAQTAVNKTIPTQPGQKVAIHFDYPDLVRVSTWDKNEVSIQGSVSINGGENDDAFELVTSVSANTIQISNVIHNLKNLPNHITVTNGAQKVTFKSKADFEKYKKDNGKDYNYMTTGVDMDITLEIKIPRNMETSVEAVYGMVEVREFMGALHVDAQYGGADVAVSEKSTGELQAETDFGQIYSNLESKFSGERSRQQDFHTVVEAKPGSGPRYRIESKFGNVYLRKSSPN